MPRSTIIWFGAPNFVRLSFNQNGKIASMPTWAGVLRERECKLLVAGGVEDHVHLLCSLGREDSIRDTVQAIKTNSSKWLRSELCPNFPWQDGFGAFTVSPSALTPVEHYIRNQEEHHRKLTFEEEMLAIFKACGIECDPRFFER